MFMGAVDLLVVMKDLTQTKGIRRNDMEGGDN